MTYLHAICVTSAVLALENVTAWIAAYELSDIKNRCNRT